MKGGFVGCLCLSLPGVVCRQQELLPASKTWILDARDDWLVTSTDVRHTSSGVQPYSIGPWREARLSGCSSPRKCTVQYMIKMYHQAHSLVPTFLLWRFAEARFLLNPKISCPRVCTSPFGDCVGSTRMKSSNDTLIALEVRQYERRKPSTQLSLP